MSHLQRATIAILIFVVVVIWGLALWAAVRPGARADQEPAANSAVTDAARGEVAVEPAETDQWTPRAEAGQAEAWTPGAEAAETGQWTPLDEAVPITSTRVATPVVSPAATTSRSATPGPAPAATPAGQSLSIPTLEVTGSQQITYTLPPPPVGTPIIPQAGRFLLVNQDEQRMYVYEDGIVVRSIPISSGRPVANAFTPAWQGDVGRYWGSGPFLNTTLWSDYMWYLFPGPRGSILIHSVPYTRDGSLKIYDQIEALGVEPVSHGCVRISPQDAEWLENWDPVGAPILITPWSGEIGPPDDTLGPNG